MFACKNYGRTATAPICPLRACRPVCELFAVMYATGLDTTLVNSLRRRTACAFAINVRGGMPTINTSDHARAKQRP